MLDSVKMSTYKLSQTCQANGIFRLKRVGKKNIFYPYMHLINGV